MRLLTLNLHCRQEESWQENLAVLAEFIHNNHVDVVLLQECAQPLGEITLSQENDVSILQSLLHQRGSDFNAQWTLNHIGFEMYLEGLGFLSRYEIQGIDEYVISQSNEITNWQTRKAQVVTMSVNGKALVVCNLHLGIENQAVAELQRFVAQIDFENMIVAGDFNTPDTDDDFGSILDIIRLPDVYREITGTSDPTFFVGADGWGQATGQRIDYVFGHGATAIKRVFTGTNSPRISDHMGLLVDFSL